MKRKLISVFLVLLLCMGLAVTAYATDSAVYDGADLLSDREEARLNAKLEEISQANSAQIVVVTTAATDGRNADSYVEYFYDSMNLGYGSSRDGVILVVCMDLREYRILSNGYASSAISPSLIDDIGDAIVSDLSDGDYYAAFDEFADQCGYYLRGYRDGFPFEFGQNLLIALVIGLVVGLIVALILRAQLKSVHRQHQADVYIKHGSMKLTAHHDIFLYRNVTRRRRESSSSSSGSRSSSRSIGGGRF